MADALSPNRAPINPMRIDDDEREAYFAASPCSYDIIAQAMAAAWEDALRVMGAPPSDPLPLWTQVAKRILAAAGEGERDPDSLKRIALQDFEVSSAPLRGEP